MLLCRSRVVSSVALMLRGGLSGNVDIRLSRVLHARTTVRTLGRLCTDASGLVVGRDLVASFRTSVVFCGMVRHVVRLGICLARRTRGLSQAKRLSMALSSGLPVRANRVLLRVRSRGVELTLGARRPWPGGACVCAHARCLRGRFRQVVHMSLVMSDVVFVRLRVDMFSLSRGSTGGKR